MDEGAEPSNNAFEELDFVRVNIFCLFMFFEQKECMWYASIVPYVQEPAYQGRWGTCSLWAFTRVVSEVLQVKYQNCVIKTKDFQSKLKGVIHNAYFGNLAPQIVNQIHSEVSIVIQFGMRFVLRLLKLLLLISGSKVALRSPGN